MGVEVDIADDRMFYVASHQGEPGYCAAAVDDPRWAKDTAKTVAGWIRDGRQVERVTDDRARVGLEEYLAYRKTKVTPLQDKQP